MSAVVLVRNPHSTKNLTAARPAELPPEIREISCADLDAMPAELSSAHTAGTSVILIDGGDGTVREVLSRVPEIWGESLPRIGILPRGNTNLIAREVGGIKSTDFVAEILHRLSDGQPLGTCRRALLRVDYPAGEYRTLRGSILGWGAYAEGTRIAHEEIASEGSLKVLRAALATLRRTLIGSGHRSLRNGVAASLSIDGEARDEAPRLIGLVTTLQRPLAGGINPFWGGGPGPIRWLDIQAPGRYLALAAPFVARGRPRRWMVRSDYASGRADRIELALDTPFIMDGELFPPPKGGPLTITAAEEIDFLSL